MVFRSLLLFVSVFGTSSLAHAQEQVAPGIPGTLDPKTGTFKPTIAAPQAVPNAAIQSVSGVLKVTLSGKVISNLPAGVRTICTMQANISGTVFKQEIASAKAIINGKTLSCTVFIPYLVHVDPSQTIMSTSYQITAFDPSDSSSPPIYGNSSTGLRLSTGPIDIIPFPSNGKLTVQSVTDIIF